MTLKEIRELLVLKEWTREQLADKLGLVRNTVDKWFCVKESQQRHPSMECVLKMRAWLTDARHTAYALDNKPASGQRKAVAGAK